MGCDGITSKKGKEKGRKGKEVPEENGRQRADREKERKLTRVCSNGFFTFIASYTYVGKSDCQPVFPPPHLLFRWHHGRNHPASLTLPFPPRELDVLLNDPDPEGKPEATFPLTSGFAFALPFSFKSFDLSSSTTNSLKNSTIGSTSGYALGLPLFHLHSSQPPHSTQSTPTRQTTNERWTIHHDLQHEIGKTHVARVDQAPGGEFLLTTVSIS